MSKELIKDVINNLIKDDHEAADKALHDVLADKMRDRIHPSEKNIEEEHDEIEEVNED